MYQQGINQFNKELTYSEVERGVGINAHEYEVIKNVSSQVYLKGVDMAKNFAEGVKQIIGGEWFASINSDKEKKNSNDEFYVTNAKDINFVSFNIEDTKFQICRLNQYQNNMIYMNNMDNMDNINNMSNMDNINNINTMNNTNNMNNTDNMNNINTMNNMNNMTNMNNTLNSQ